MLLRKNPGTSLDPHRVSAMQVTQGDGGSLRMGLLTQLELNPEVFVSGPGFDDKTVRIRSGEHSYFVFRDDLVRAGFGAVEIPLIASVAS